MPPAPLPSAGELLSQIEVRRQAVSALRALVRVEYRDPEVRGAARQAVVASRPNRFRVEIFSVAGVASLAVCDGDTLAVYFPEDRAVYRGPATAANVAYYLRVGLSPTEAVDLLLGLPGGPIPATDGRLSFDQGRGLLRVEVAAAEGGRRVLWFDDRWRRLIRSEEVAPDGALLSWAQFSGYESVDGLWFPREVSLSDERERRTVTLRYERVELNPVLPEGVFTLPSQVGVRELDVGDPRGTR